MSISAAQHEMLEQIVAEYREGNHSEKIQTKMLDIILPELTNYAQSLAFRNELRVHDAGTLINETYKRGLEALQKGNCKGDYMTYIKGIMKNVARDDTKEHKVRADQAFIQYDDGSSDPAEEYFIETLPEKQMEWQPQDALEESELFKLLKQFVEDLPARQKEIVGMRFKGMKQKEIAEVLGLNHSTVSNSLKEAVKNLNEKVTEYEKKHDVRLHGFFALPFMSSLIRDLDLPGAISESAMEGIKANILSQLGFADAIVGAAEAGSAIAAAGESAAVTSGVAAGSASASGAGAAAKAGLGVLLKSATAKVAAAAIAVSLVGGGVYYSATHPMFGAPSEEQQYYETIVEEDVDEIVLGEDIADKLVVGEEGVWVKFTPEETGFYVFKTKMSSKFQKKGIQITSFRGEIDERKIMHTPGIIIGEDQKNKGTYIIQTADDGMLYAGSTYYIRIQHKVDHGISSMYLDTAVRREVPQAPQLEKKSDAIVVNEGDDLATHLKKGETWFVFTPTETAMYRFEIGNGKSWNAKNVELICTYKTNTTEFDRVGSGVEAFQDYEKGIHCLYFATDAGNILEAGKKYYIQFDLKKDGVFQNLKLTRTEESHDEEQLVNPAAALTVTEGEDFAGKLKQGENWIAFTPENGGMYRMEAPSSKKFNGNNVALITYKSSTTRYDQVGLGISAVTDSKKGIHCLYFADEVGNRLEGGVTYYLNINLKADGVFDSIKILPTDETLKDVESRLE